MPHLQAEATLSRGYCVVIPMFNEEVNAERCIRRISEALQATVPSGSFIVVDDGSRDSTAHILRRMKEEYPALLIVTHAQNKGYGTAIVTGIAEAAARGLGYVLFMDSDLTTDPKYIPAFVEKMRGDHDVIKATRYSLGGGMDGVPPHRAWVSRIGNMIARVFFRLPIADCTNGFRAVKVDILSRIPFREHAFAIIMEEMYYVSALARTYAEVPYILTSRGPDQGITRFVYRPKIFLQYLKYAVLSLLRPPVLDEVGHPMENQ